MYLSACFLSFDLAVLCVKKSEDKSQPFGQLMNDSIQMTLGASFGGPEPSPNYMCIRKASRTGDQDCIHKKAVILFPNISIKF